MLETDIRDNLKLYIDDKCYCQGSLARKAKMRPSQLSMVLNKQRKLYAEELFRLCDAMEITPIILREYISPSATQQATNPECDVG